MVSSRLNPSSAGKSNLNILIVAALTIEVDGAGAQVFRLSIKSDGPPAVLPITETSVPWV